MKLSFLCCVFAFSSITALAQLSSERPLLNMTPPIQIGPLIGINGAMSTIDYKVEGQTRSIGYGSLFGVIGDIPLNQSISIVARLGYYTLAFSDENKAIDITPSQGTDQDHSFGAARLTTEGSFNYLSFGPMIRFGSLALGFNFSLPLTATINNTLSSGALPIGFGSYSLKSDISPTDEERAFLMEATIGADVPLYSTDQGRLRLGVFASYPMTTMLKSSGKNYPHLDSNFRLPSLMLQVAYLFSM